MGDPKALKSELVVTDKSKRLREMKATTVEADTDQDYKVAKVTSGGVYYEGYIGRKKYMVPDATLEAMKDVVNLRLRPRRSKKYKHETSYELTGYDHLNKKMKKMLSKINEELDTSSETDDSSTENEDELKKQIEGSGPDNNNATKERKEGKPDEKGREKEGETDGGRKLKEDEMRGSRVGSEDRPDRKSKGKEGESSGIEKPYEGKIEKDRMGRENGTDEKTEEKSETNGGRQTKEGGMGGEENKSIGKSGRKEGETDGGSSKESIDALIVFVSKNRESGENSIGSEGRPDDKVKGKEAETSGRGKGKDETDGRRISKGGETSKDRIGREGEADGKRQGKDDTTYDKGTRKISETDKKRKGENGITDKQQIKKEDTPTGKRMSRESEADKRMGGKGQAGEYTKLKENENDEKVNYTEGRDVGLDVTIPKEHMDEYPLKCLISGHIRRDGKPIYIFQEYSGKSKIFEEDKPDMFLTKKEGNVNIFLRAKAFKENILRERNGKPSYLNLKTDKIYIDDQNSRVYPKQFIEVFRKGEYIITIKGEFKDSDVNKMTPLISITLKKEEDSNSRYAGKETTVYVCRPSTAGSNPFRQTDSETEAYSQNLGNKKTKGFFCKMTDSNLLQTVFSKLRF